MFRSLLGHLQALWENKSKSYLYFNVLWDPKCCKNLGSHNAWRCRPENMLFLLYIK